MRISDWSSDVCSSDLGPLVEELARRPITSVVHSDMARTRALALPLARRCGVPLIVDPRWRERDFGSWEGDRKSVVSGKSVSVRVALVGRRIIKKKKITIQLLRSCIVRHYTRYQ